MQLISAALQFTAVWGTWVRCVLHTRPRPGQPKEVGEEEMAPAMTSG